MSKPQTNSGLGRLKLIGTGLALVGVGMTRMRSGVQVVTNSIGQPMFSWGLVAAGLLWLVLAFVPISWIEMAAETQSAKPKGRRQS